ncbi:PREDICTED: interferon regulatory factor 4-like [Gekko japonicus]|uniref:Interferon regulatory factor 4-like n=1 Tax=Gekko japonicus TaxID=146911 RepID=A0ABM1KL38_GEKJA|nr:PREDICTED: interferon regulatory factor 4-like [Gekko japonicus]
MTSEHSVEQRKRRDDVIGAARRSRLDIAESCSRHDAASGRPAEGSRRRGDLLQAWAIHKGKFHEGLDKADPSVWKTRLRCALNKSTDFQEVPERSHLDISEPYKVYRVVSLPESHDADKETVKEAVLDPAQPSTSGHQESRVECQPSKAAPSSESGQESADGPAGTCQVSSAPQNLQTPNRDEQQGYQIKGYFCNWSPVQFRCHPSLRFPDPRSQYGFSENINSDCWLYVRIYYTDVLVKEVTTNSSEGCRITYRPVPAEDERLYGPSSIEQIQLPSPEALAGNGRAARTADIVQRLLPHLHRGVLLWVAPEGLFLKRQCQGRVYWKGPLAAHDDRPNKLEREKTYKLLDTQQFLQQLRGYLCHGEPPPQYQIHLCFGEEYPAAPGQKLHKFIMAQVEPVFARDLFQHAQRLGPGSLPDSESCRPDVPESIVQILKQRCPP